MDSTFRKSTFSNPSGDCVEVARGTDDVIRVRDSKDKGTGLTLSFTPAEWRAFLEGARADEFNV